MHNPPPSLSLYCESTSTPDAECPVIFLKIYFDFAYYLLLSPFRIEVSEETGKFIIKKNKLQQVVRKKFIYLFFGTFVTLSIVSLVIGKRFVPNVSWLSPSLWFNQLVKLARYTLFIDSTVFDPNDTCILQNITGWDTVAAIFTLFGIIPRLIIGYFADLCILSCAIPLWLISKTFSVAVAEKYDVQHLCDYDEGRNWRKHGTELNSNWLEIYQHFKAIQRLSLAVNIALGSIVTWFLAEAIMYYSKNLTDLLRSTDIFWTIDKISFYVLTVGIFIFSADICNQLENVKLWFYRGENRKTVPSDEFNLILHEMIAKDIGIRGSNIFTITYSFLALFLSTIVTFFIICLQDGSGTDTVSPLQLLAEANSSCPLK
ncbi:unnamed protein product [Orchesella dallaii]|uniref:Gustatory receptor n=1 Tax=Orchesella dallaii TaxID=48710 RepID=A0ABP1PQY7_9HEXA